MKHGSNRSRRQYRHAAVLRVSASLAVFVCLLHSLEIESILTLGLELAIH